MHLYKKTCVATVSRHLAALHASADLLPNRYILTNTLPSWEAQASSEIENIVRQGKTKLFVNKRLLALLRTETEVWQPFK